MKKTILQKEVQKKIKNGIDVITDILRTTIGRGGYNAIIGKLGRFPIITNDGVSIAREIEVEDEIEQLGVDMIKQVCENTNKEVGDGTTTSSVLARAIIDRGLELIGDEKSLVKNNPIEVRAKLNQACKEVVEQLKKLSKPVEDLQKVAKVSVEDEKIGQIIADVYKELGDDGIVLSEEGDGYEIISEVTKGINIDSGLISPYFGEKGKCILKDVEVLVMEKFDLEKISKKIESLKVNNKKELLLILKDIKPDEIGLCVWNKLNKVFTLVPLKIWDDNIREDIIVAIGDQPIDKVIIGEHSTSIIGTKGNLEEIINTLKGIKAENDYEEEKLKKRIASLGGGIGIIKVGAKTEVEREYLRLKVEDAINAVKASIEEGVVPGGGKALYGIENEVFGDALKEPYKAIQENCKEEISDDIIDPTKVVRVALENAVSVAGTFITTKSAIAIKEEKQCGCSTQ